MSVRYKYSQYEFLSPFAQHPLYRMDTMRRCYINIFQSHLFFHVDQMEQKRYEIKHLHRPLIQFIFLKTKP